MDRNGVAKSFGKVMGTFAHFSEGLAPALGPDAKKWGYINTNGEFVIAPQFETSELRPFREGRAAFHVGSRWGFIDRGGNIVVEAKYATVSEFREGRAAVGLDDGCACKENGCLAEVILGIRKRNDPVVCRMAVIDLEGQLLSEERFDEIHSFREGLAPAKRDGKWGFIDRSAKFVVAPTFEWLRPLAGGLARAKQEARKGYVNRRGEFVLQLNLEVAGDFVDGVARVGTDEGEVWFIDSSGQRVHQESFLFATSYFKGLAHVQLKSGKYAYIDRWGRHVFEYVKD